MVRDKNQKLSKENLRIKDYSSAFALKKKIRKMIAKRKLEHLELCCMNSAGAYLSMTFVNQL